MVSKRRRLSSKLDAGVDMTPMLDIVFIMLIFFIVSAVFLNEKGLDLRQTPPSNSFDVGLTTIGVYVYADGSALVDGQTLDVSAVPSRVEVLRAERPGAPVSIRSEYGVALEKIVFLEDQFAIAGIPTSLKID
ncbi:MAG: biopolymer transporter ExbD [Acidimicrobiales bacterium]|nr:biopolymer transporter ExbD [Hyphomonadaceae bacterium]RZV43017.1 MAG: biopolymer transporter ExbD [Acidimicrobiales bacterium]